MIEAILKNKSRSFKISVKVIITALLICLAVALPQIAHFFGGTAAGAAYLPMYAPVLLAGCILGIRWGLLTGILSPVASFAFTSLFLSSAMPASAKLPYMILELAVFGIVSGLFSKKIAKTPLVSFPAVIAAQVAGRLCFFLSSVLFGADALSVWQTIQAGLIGLYIQAAIVPLIIMPLCAAVKRDGND